MPTYETDDVNDPYYQFLRSRHFYNLDWLRGIAILLVLAHHIPNWGGDYFSTLRDNGRYGVSLFFGISGFLICSLLIREKQQQGQINLYYFYIRRSLRLFPLYYAVLGYCLLNVGSRH